MALHNGVDTVSILSMGVYSETYTSVTPSAIASLLTSFGLLEDAPVLVVVPGSSWGIIGAALRKILG